MKLLKESEKCSFLSLWKTFEISLKVGFLFIDLTLIWFRKVDNLPGLKKGRYYPGYGNTVHELTLTLHFAHFPVFSTQAPHLKTPNIHSEVN